MEKVLSVINSKLLINKDTITLFKQIGEGAYSQVWKAKYFEGYRSVGIDVAVKIISTTDEAVLSFFFFIYVYFIYADASRML